MQEQKQNKKSVRNGHFAKTIKYIASIEKKKEGKSREQFRTINLLCFCFSPREK